MRNHMTLIRQLWIDSDNPSFKFKNNFLGSSKLLGFRLTHQLPTSCWTTRRFFHTLNNPTYADRIPRRPGHLQDSSR
jgi:hypothetical protein